MWQPLVRAGLAQQPAAFVPLFAAYWAQADRASDTDISLPFPPPSSPLLHSPNNQDLGQGKDICIQQQKGQTFTPFADTV